jgi:hypothetical protein
VDILLRRLKVNNRPALVSKAYSMGLLRQGWPPHVNPEYLKLAESGHVGTCRHAALQGRPRRLAAGGRPAVWPLVAAPPWPLVAGRDGLAG